MENFVQTNLRIITRQSFRELWALFHLLEVKAQVYEFLRGSYIKVTLTVYTVNKVSRRPS